MLLKVGLRAWQRLRGTYLDDEKRSTYTTRIHEEKDALGLRIV